MDVNFPESTKPEVRETVNAILEDVAELEIEDRQYAISPDEFPEDSEVTESANGLFYTVNGTKPWAADAAVGKDDKNDGFLRIAVVWNSHKDHWGDPGMYENPDHAGRIYDIMDLHGVTRPSGADEHGRPLWPTVGVQFGNRGRIAVENVIPEAFQ